MPDLVEVPLDVLFSLLNLADGEDQWTFYVNFRPRIDDQGLADRLYGASGPAIPFREIAAYLPAARVLVEEVRSYVPPPPTVVLGGVELPIRGGMTGLSHHIRWSDFDTMSIEWVRHYRLGTDGYAVQPGQGRVASGSLSGAARAAVKRLDALATETAYARFSELVRAAAAVPLDVELVPRKRVVFISYRGPDVFTAEALHAQLTAYGNSTIFTTYLDRHDLPLGELRSHLRERIEHSDLFVPIVTPSYAPDGTISNEELAWAEEIASRRGSREHFIAPVFVGRPDTDVARRLDPLVRLQISEPDAIIRSDRNVQDFLRMCAIPY